MNPLWLILPLIAATLSGIAMVRRSGWNDFTAWEAIFGIAGYVSGIIFGIVGAIRHSQANIYTALALLLLATATMMIPPIRAYRRRNDRTTYSSPEVRRGRLAEVIDLRNGAQHQD